VSRTPRPAASVRSGLAVAALALAGLVVACGPSSTAYSTPGPNDQASLVAPASATPGPSSAALGSPVTGVLTHIDSSGLAAVAGFTLRLDDGRVVAFKIGTLENGASFPPGHLAEHLGTAEPVRVYFRPQGTDLVVYRIEDASASPAPS